MWVQVETSSRLYQFISRFESLLVVKRQVNESRGLDAISKGLLAKDRDFSPTTAAQAISEIGSSDNWIRGAG